MDNERLKKMLSAWFDKELSPSEMAEVEAFIAQSDEAEQIVAEFRALQKLAQTSQASRDEYWERSAARIEATLDSASDSKIVPIRKSKKSNWAVKALSIAASISILTFIGLNRSEIIDSMNSKEGLPAQLKDGHLRVGPDPDMSVDSISRQDRIVESDLKDDDQPVEIDRRENYEADDQELEKPREEVDVVSLEDVAGIVEEGTGDLYIRGGRAGEIGYTVDGGPVVISAAKPESEAGLSEPDKSEPDKSVAKSLSEVKSAPAASAPSESVINELETVTEANPKLELRSRDLKKKSVIRTVESLVADQNYVSKQKRSIDGLTALAESVVTDSDELITAEEMLEIDRSDIRYRQLWERDILARLETIKVVDYLERASKVMANPDEGARSLGYRLKEARKKEEAKSKKSERKQRVKSALKSDSVKTADEKELLDAAFYIGSKNIYEKEYDQAIRYLTWMAKTNRGTLNRKHAKKLLNELLDLKED